MKAVELEAFKRFSFISRPGFSPRGTKLACVVTTIDNKSGSYKSCIYIRKGSRFVKLTNGGRERDFRFLDEDRILFRADREEDKDFDGSRFYEISLSGGEARLALELPLQIGTLLPLKDGNYIVTASVTPGFEELYKGDKKYIERYKKQLKENEDYEEISQTPWWWNGATFTKGSYESLFLYNSKKKSFTRLSELNENVSDVKLSADEKTVYFIHTEVKPLLKMCGTQCLCSINLEDGGRTELIRCTEEYEFCRYELCSSFIALLLHNREHGRNTDPDFYKMPYGGGEPTLWAKHGEVIGSSVGSDIRYGDGCDIKAEGDRIWFISTRFDGAYLFCLDENGISRITDRPGSVDSFDVCGDRLVLCALYDMKGQELYDVNGKQLSHFNDRVLKNYYVAAPEKLNVTVNGEEIHGFVLKPMNAEPGKKSPVIIDIHGGPKTVYGEVFYHEMQYWAGLGYYVIFCNPHGSDGRGGFFDICGKYGTVDYEDIMAFCDAALEAYPDMDADNFFETGGSYGGFMTNWIIGHTDRFRACASQRSISNWFSFYNISDIGPEFCGDQNSSNPWSDPEKLWWHSPLKYADRAKTPTLFIHSFEDYRCPIDQGYQMFNALLQHGVESKLVAFRGENHNLSRTGKPAHRVKRLQEITEWFNSHKV